MEEMCLSKDKSLSKTTPRFYSGKGSRRKNGEIESNGNGGEFETLLRGTNEEEFSF